MKNSEARKDDYELRITDYGQKRQIRIVSVAEGIRVIRVLKK